MVLVGWYIRGYTQKYSDALAGVVDQDRKCCLVGHYLFICWSHDALQLSRDFSTLVMSCTQDQKKRSQLKYLRVFAEELDLTLFWP